MTHTAPLLRILALLAVALAGIAMAQDRLLYFPDRVPLAELSRYAPPAMRVAPWPSAEEFRALLVEPEEGSVRGTVVVFHGNAGHAGHRLFYAEALNPLGWRVLLAEYPGYGPRDGALGEVSLVEDAARTVALAQEKFGATVLLGESLGAGVAAAASARLRHREITALLLVTPWDTLAEVATHHYPWLPVRWLLRDRYDSVAHLRDFPGPVTVVIAERDSVVPPERGRALYAHLPGGRLLTIDGADHNDWLDRVDAQWWRALVDGVTRSRTASVD